MGMLGIFIHFGKLEKGMTAYQIKRTDANQQEIMNALRDGGWVVWDSHTLGGGFPDCIAFKDGRTVLVECKMPGKKLNRKEQEFFDKCPGAKVIIYHRDEALQKVEEARK